MITPPLRQVTIVGLGLIGGSIAKSLRARHPELILVAVDRDNVGARSDVQATVNRFVNATALDEQDVAISRSDLVVLCQPVSAIADAIGRYLRPRGIVTDTGSTKRKIVECAARHAGNDWYVPGHPMAGKELGGFEHASADIFVDRPWIICPQGRDPEAVAYVEQFVDGLGAQRIIMTPEQHDSAVAVVSHVPQLLSSWLRTKGYRHNALSVAGPAFRDMTRVAGGSDAIWRDIFATNADEIGRVLQDGALALSALADALLCKPPRVDRVLEILEEARRTKVEKVQGIPTDHD